MIQVYGASDDLIEIDGAISDEVDCYGHKKPIKITASDGTIASIFYDGDWKIRVKFAGEKYVEVVDSVGEDKEHKTINAVGCTSYSDVLVFENGLEWIKIKGKTFKPWVK